MEMNSALFDELAASYKSDRQRYEEHTVMFVFFKQPGCLQRRLNANFFLRERKKDKEREDLWRKLEDLELRRGIQNSDGVIPT